MFGALLAMVILAPTAQAAEQGCRVEYRPTDTGAWEVVRGDWRALTDDAVVTVVAPTGADTSRADLFAASVAENTGGVTAPQQRAKSWRGEARVIATCPR